MARKTVEKKVKSTTQKTAKSATPEVIKSVSEPIMKSRTIRKRKAVETVPKKNGEDESSKVNKTKAKKQKFSIQVPPQRTVSGKVFVIGENNSGQLGLGEDVEVKKRPALLDLPQPVVDIAAGGMHSVCLTESGEVITFGCNDEGALGRLTTQEGSEYIPHRVEIPERIIQVSAGDSHSAALSESGQVYIWGNFRFKDGPVGLTRDGQKKTTPVRILTGETVVKIASGEDHLVCLSSAGLVYTLGRADNGQLGRVIPRWSVDGGRRGLASLLEPGVVFVSRNVTIEELWTGSCATFLRAHDTGSIWAFGLNNYNQLGYEGELNSFMPRRVPSFDNEVWNEISADEHHTLALNNGGLVFSMGKKDYGRLGLGENCTDKSSPTVIPTLENEKCTNISCGNWVSYAVTEEGSVFSWGFGDNHQLGHGDDKDCHVPKQIEGNFSKSWKALKVSGGGQHTLILACPRESTTTKTTNV